MKIKNIVFDVGNVLVHWNPLSVVEHIFPDYSDSVTLTKQLFKSSYWLDLNKGIISENDLIQHYHQSLNLNLSQLKILMQAIKESLIPVEGSFELLKILSSTNISLFALTDNTVEFMDYLQKKYDFWKLFQGIVVSAYIGHLKPSPEIYNYLLTNYKLNANETLFIDDHLPNIDGARAVGISAFQFKTIEQCINELKQYGILV